MFLYIFFPWHFIGFLQEYSIRHITLCSMSLSLPKIWCLLTTSWWIVIKIYANTLRDRPLTIFQGYLIYYEHFDSLKVFSDIELKSMCLFLKLLVPVWFIKVPHEKQSTYCSIYLLPSFLPSVIYLSFICLSQNLKIC